MSIPIPFFARTVAVAVLLSTSAQADVFYQFHIDLVATHKVERLTDLTPGSDDSMDRWYMSTQMPHYMIAYNGAVYFRGDDGSSGAELWRHDGNTAALVADIMPGPKGSLPEWFAVYDGDLYFTAESPTVGTELMRYDGFAVTVAADVAPGNDLHSRVGPKTVYGGELYFGANTGEVGYELYRFDGNAVSLAADVNNKPGTNHKGVRACCIVFNGDLYFAGDDGTGMEPWRFDGNTAQKAVDINPNGGSGPFWEGMHAAVLGNRLYFPASDAASGSGHGSELWQFDGSTASMVADIAAGPKHASPNSLAVHGGSLYFSATSYTYGAEIHRYDGTTLSVPVDIVTGPTNGGTGGRNLISYGSALYFSGVTTSAGNREVLRLTGSTYDIAADVNHTSGGLYPSSSFPEDFTVLGDYLYFSADDGVHGRELWRLKPQPIIKIYGQVGRMFDPFWEWPIDPLDRETVVALFAVPLRGDPRLIDRFSLLESELLDDRHEKSFEVDPDALALADSFGLVFLGFDTASGRPLGHYGDVYGEPSDEVDAELRRRSDAFATGLSLDELREYGGGRR